MTSPSRSPWEALALTALSVAAIASASFGCWVALCYQGGTPLLMPFAAVALVGALVCLWGIVRRSALAVGVGAIAQVLAPTGAAWAGSLIVALCGAILLIACRVARRRASG